MRGLLALTACMSIVGCANKETDFYDPGIVQREAAQSANATYADKFASNVGLVNENQDWNLLATRGVSVSVGGDAAQDYTLYVCSENPAVSKHCTLLGMTTAKGGTTATVDVTTSKSADVVYVLRADANQQFVAGARLDGDSYVATFSVPTAAGSRRASAVVSGDPFTFESTDSYYKTVDDIPANAKTPNDFVREDWGGAIDQNAMQGASAFKLADGAYSLHLWAGSRDMYVSGNVTLDVTNANSINQARIYVLPGATLNFNMSDYINNLEIYVSATATLNYNAEKLYKQDGGGKIYNRGVLNFMQSNFEANQDAVVYNEGEVNATNITSKPGDGHSSFFYNFGDLNMKGNFELNSCANFYNEGNTTVEGETSVTQKNIYWINKGHYVTGPMQFSAKNTTFYNFCQLQVNGNAHMYDGEFNLMDGSYIVAETAEFDNFIVNMGNNAGFNILGDTDWAAQGDGTYQGFRTMKTGDKAYVRLGGTTTVAGHLRSLEMTGHITYAINEIVDLGADNSGVQPTYVLDNDGVVGAPFASTSFSTTPGVCAATWGSGGGIVTPEAPVMYSIAFEDLGSIGDFDFNDVVLYVAHRMKDQKAKVYFMAAGGELDVDVKYDTQTLFTKTDGRITNTQNPRGEIIDSAEIDMTGVADLQKFSIVVKKTNAVSLTVGSANVKGHAPQALIIPGEWAWPIEQVNIKDAYPDFVKWVENVTNSNWYDNPDLNKVVR